MADTEKKPSPPAETSHEGGSVQVAFLKDYQVKDEIATSYTKGSKVKMSEASANHFIKRGIAEKV